VRIARADLLRVARLAELEVPEADAGELAAQLDRIVEYVAQLGDLGLDPGPPFIPGPGSAPLRPDIVDPIPLARPPADLAPDFREGFFVVPRLAGMEGA
jgi:aspartyl-tRNA(Asn)/glutamyl-tRNA(Gln) amidotransferase subunit C